MKCDYRPEWPFPGIGVAPAAPFALCYIMCRAGALHHPGNTMHLSALWIKRIWGPVELYFSFHRGVVGTTKRFSPRRKAAKEMRWWPTATGIWIVYGYSYASLPGLITNHPRITQALQPGLNYVSLLGLPREIGFSFHWGLQREYHWGVDAPMADT